MTETTYDWKRYWYPRGSTVSLGAGGYLVDPEGEYGHIWNPDLVTLETLDEVACLVLLGEPGIGKSNALESLKKQRAKEWQRDGIVVASLDLRSYGSEDRLVKDLFETEQFHQWLRADTFLMLILDSLDECLLRIDTVATMLIDELGKRKVPVNRLRLRLTCRSAVWPEVLEKGLSDLWGHQDIGVYEMAPLRLVDIAMAAEANAIDPVTFISVIQERDALPFAIKPVTLELLVRLFLGPGSLPSSPVELYERGLRKLCEEINESRKASGRTGSLIPEQRLLLASRIAAMTTLAGKEAIWIGSDDVDLVEVDAPWWDLLGGSEESLGSHFEANAAAIRETLDTALFVSRGPNRLGFFHSTYAEFLAARYLTQHEMSTSQIMNLISHSGDPESRLAPQQHGTAAWLAAMRSDVFRAVIKTDPDVMLRSDVSTATESDRQELVGNLLHLYNEERLMDPKIGSRHLYIKLRHPRLADQVIDYICNRSKTSLARCEALEIARFCRLEECQEPALDIFLDPSEEEPVRRTAGYVLLAVGDEMTKSRMKPLACGDHPEDVFDELKGLALKALWPNCISSHDVFSLITAPKRDSFHGTYKGFVHSLPETLDAMDMLQALDWVQKQPPRQSLPYMLRDLMDGIMIRAWNCLEYPTLARMFAKACLARLELDYCLAESFPEGTNWIDIVGQQGKRRTVLNILFRLLSESPNRTVLLVSSQTPLVLVEDFAWLLEHLGESKDEDVQKVVARLLSLVFSGDDRNQVDQMLAAVQDSAVLGDQLSWLWKPVVLDSPEAEKMKTDRLEQSEWEAAEAGREKQQQESYSFLLVLLDECEAGHPSFFSKLTEELILRPRPVADHKLLEADLTRLPGWQVADNVTRKRIVEASKRYLLDNDAEPEGWVGTEKYDQAVFAGYKALRLILSEEPDFLSIISVAVWRKWAPVVIAYPTRLGFGDEETFMRLVSVAFEVVPETILNTLTSLIEKENQQYGHVISTRKIRYCRGPAVELALLAKLRDYALTPASSGVLLDELLARNVPQAKGYAEDLVRTSSRLQGAARQKSVIAASLLVFHIKEMAWRIVWPAVETDVDFGLNIIPLIASWDSDNSSLILRSLHEENLGRLFVWLTQHYPHDEDPKYDNFHEVGVREKIADWRDSIPIELRDRATREALDALRHIQDEFPGLSGLKWTLAEAYDIHRKNSWVPPEPRQILEMALDTRKRLVRSERELLEVVSESLRSLEKELQGETPAVVFLWDHIKDDQYKPKREMDFSDYIKLHLENELSDRGVVVNREVQIHRGERTDIYVNALSKSPRDGFYDSITVIIEVKGCWHNQLWQAMETQLVGQYMTNNPCNTGLYVVGWFNCKHWALQDLQTKQLGKEILAMEISEAQSCLDIQANGLSSGGNLLGAMVLDTGLHKG